MRIEQRLTMWAPRILGALRIVAGALFACYGVQKVFGLFGGMPPGAPTWIIWTAGSIELVGGTLIMLGICTRIAAFICSGQMAAAYFMGHAPNGFWPIVNHGELAVLFCWLFLYFAAQGPGAFALDNLRRRAA